MIMQAPGSRRVRTAEAMGGSSRHRLAARTKVRKPTASAPGVVGGGGGGDAGSAGGTHDTTYTGAHWAPRRRLSTWKAVLGWAPGGSSLFPALPCPGCR